MTISHTSRAFVSRGEYYAQNIADSAGTNAFPAKLTNTAGDEENGVAILLGSKPRMILTAAAALRLANQIADSIDFLEGRTP